MFLTTDDETFLVDLERSPCHHADVFDADGFDWDRVAVPARLDLATVDSRLPDTSRVRDSVISGADRIVGLQRSQPWGQPYLPDAGWDWGSNGRILNNLVVLATAYDLTARTDYLDATMTGIDYLFGLNALGQSYVTGYGTDHTRHQRTRHFARRPRPRVPASAPWCDRWGSVLEDLRRASRPTIGSASCRRSSAISTSRRRRTPTTSVSDGTCRSCGSPLSLPTPRRRVRASPDGTRGCPRCYAS